ncbi:flagellar biosynthesis anti-sigma factor FlgM [Novosphingobium sp.]|uniref:flagellar biosynthesis anti-sigma factor FlgM n=1 Tax=Novosphingobium sp. TaxID=1874826 RepID=UPI0035AE5716
MPPIELGPSGPHAPRAVGGVDARIVKTAADAPERRTGAAPSAAGSTTVVRSDALDAGAPPINAERVTEIRKAIENGSYPVIPMRVADAMIAAGLLLRSEK